MEQERNPNKNAELAMEQNGNMIDGIQHGSLYAENGAQRLCPPR